MEMNILFSSDDNYAQHLGVAMYSFMCHNTKADKLKFFVVNNNISQENISKLLVMVSQFPNSEVLFIPFDYYTKGLLLNMPWPISLSAYARLFASEMLSKDIDRVLYLDCDMIINHDLSELWEYDLGDNCIGAVQDQVKDNIKTSIGLTVSQPYFNSGMLLVDLKKWRSQNIGLQAINFIREHKGRVIHHDQGVLNAILRKSWTRLPLKFNVMTIHFLMNHNSILNYFGDRSEYYEEEEVERGKYQSWILHFTPSFTSRPWEENCKHPLQSLYHIMRCKTPWALSSLTSESARWYVRLINWRYRTLPF